MSDLYRTTDFDTADAGAQGGGPPTAKGRAAVQRAVGDLLDALAPERAAPRTGRPRGAVERHRTPRGCILQAAAGAVSVSWFPNAAADAAFGELQVVAWRGVVSRPGSAHRVGGAAVERELVLCPIERGSGEWAWRATDGTVYDSAALVAHCLALLEERIGGAAPVVEDADE
jgi:hypothetical protein